MNAARRKRTAESSRRNEFAYRELFKHMTQGLAYCKVITEKGAVPDFIHVAANDSFELLTGLKDVVGKKVSEVVPGIQESDREVLEIYARVARSGVPEKFEIFIRALYKWFSVSVYSPKKDYFVAIFDDITERKRTEGLLRARQLEAKTLLDNAPDVIVRVDRQGRYTYVNATTARVAGIPSEAFLGKTPRELGLPQDLCELFEKVFHGVLGTGCPDIFEFRYPGPGGETLWEERVHPEFGADGSVQSVLSIARDITAKKRLEEVSEAAHRQIRDLAASLLKAQEDERRRIARELHDDLCQKVAGLGIEASILAKPSDKLPDALAKKILQLGRNINSLADEVHRASRLLHPAILEDLGLAAALREECSSLTARSGISVEFRTERVPRALPNDIALCLFRVAQESLRNIERHSGARQARVYLRRSKGSITLSIHDGGSGFDAGAARQDGGLGLISMQERARLVNGKLSVEAKPGRGTRIGLQVPLPAAQPLKRTVQQRDRA